MDPHRDSGYRRTMIGFRSSVHGVLKQLFDGSLPETGEQPQATALAMALTLDLARIGGSEPTLVGAPHSPKTKHMLDDAGLRYEHREHMVDFVAVSRLRANIDLPVVACESEVNPTHGVGYAFDLSPWNRRPMNGYVWDFRKLLHFRAPRLVFVARVNKGRNDQEDRIATLEQTLADCAADHATVWGGSRLDVLLLPNGQRETSLARVQEFPSRSSSCLLDP